MHIDLTTYSFRFLNLIASIVPTKDAITLIGADLQSEKPMSSPQDPSTDSLNDEGLQKILKAMADLKFGSVEITVHEGRIVQIERKEKVRLNVNLNASSIRSQP